jgi:AcrR family transcriptional regulator
MSVETKIGDSKTETQEDILWAALDLFIENGYDATTMRMIMQRTGKQSGSIYYLFDGKEDILRMAVASVYKKTLILADITAGPYRGDFTVLILPQMVLLYSAERDHDLARLLHRAFSTSSVARGCTDLAWEWIGKYGIEGIGEEEFKMDFLYALGGLGAMFGRMCEEGAESYRVMLNRYTMALYGLFGLDRPESLERTIDSLCSIYEESDITIMSRLMRESI